jgi:hypothetical protein
MGMNRARRERRKAAEAQRLREAPRQRAEKVGVHPWGPGLYFFATDAEARRGPPPAKLKCGHLVSPEQLKYFEKTGCQLCSSSAP